LRAGDVIALSGDLGAGKTSLGKRLSKIFNLLLRLKRL
jgi:tRNA A37 threonylcarbamoyladenosine biosynthesis protein TsaE